MVEPSIPEQGRPDPSRETTAQLDRGLAAERDFVEGKVAVLQERLDRIDKATELLNETVNRVPTDVQQEAVHIMLLFEEKLKAFEEKFHSIQTQFLERDTRQEREARDNKVAVDAAFAAQKEAAAKQDESNLKAIDKSEVATAETIQKLSQLVDSNLSSLSDKVDALTRRLDKLV